MVCLHWKDLRLVSAWSQLRTCLWIQSWDLVSTETKSQAETIFCLRLKISLWIRPLVSKVDKQIHTHIHISNWSTGRQNSVNIKILESFTQTHTPNYIHMYISLWSTGRQNAVNIKKYMKACQPNLYCRLCRPCRPNVVHECSLVSVIYIQHFI